MKKVIVLVTIAVVGVLTVMVLMLRAHEDSVTAGIVAQANRLDIPSDWVLLGETITPEQTICLTICPNVSRRWQIGAKVSPADLQRIAQPIGVVLTIEGKCVGDSACSGTVAYGDYRLSLNADNNGTDSALTLDLRGR